MISLIVYSLSLVLFFFVRLFDTGAIPVSLRARDNSSFCSCVRPCVSKSTTKKITYSPSSSFPFFDSCDYHDEMDLLPSMADSSIHDGEIKVNDECAYLILCIDWKYKHPIGR